MNTQGSEVAQSVSRPITALVRKKNLSVRGLNRLHGTAAIESFVSTREWVQRNLY